MTLLFVGLFLLVAASASAVILRSHRWSDRVYVALVMSGCAAALVPAIQVLAGGSSLLIIVPASVPGGDWAFGVDPLSAVFLVGVLGVGAAAAVFGTGYMAPERAHRSVWPAHAVFALLVAALVLVVTAQAVVPFLVAWELMALGSYLLIVTEHQHADVRRAGLVYLAATHAGTLALFALFAVWGQSGGDWSFAGLAAAGPRLAAGSVAAVFALALFGFGVKTGLVPLHFWLPPAHAAAPSHVSALMSGVVIKTGIYGFLRVITLLGTPPAWWGWLVLAIGIASSVLGVVWALAQHDIKRLLAYHSVENIGIILIGIGIGALGAAYGQPAIAVIGYGAAALHTVNHALFKSLLFLGSGAIVRMTGTRNMEELGGLARRMPITWLTFLVGCAAIIGVPPFNGFVSEWLVYQGLFRAGQAGGGMRLAMLGAPALALVGGLALACFAKVAGVVFLGQPRTPRPLHAREVGPTMFIPSVALAGACAAIGFAPVFVFPAILRTGTCVAWRNECGLSARSASLVAPELGSVFAGAQRISLVVGSLVGVLVILWAARALAVRRRSIRMAETWGCGYGEPTPRMQYTASSFAAPLLEVWGPVSGVHEHHGATVFHSTPTDLVLEGMVLPLWQRVRRAAVRLRPIQQGRLHVYLLYVAVTLLAMLAYLVFGPTD